MRTVDCQIYKRLLTLHSLIQSTIFINPTSDYDEEAQVHTICQARKINFNDGLRSVQYSEIPKQFKLVQDAMLEEKKFLAYIESDKWPEGMASFRINLLQSTFLDDEIT